MTPQKTWARVSRNIALQLSLVFLKNLTTNEDEIYTGKLPSSFTVSRDLCHGKKIDLQKVSKPFKDTWHYW